MGRAGPQQFETDPPITGGASGGFYEAAEAPTRAALPASGWEVFMGGLRNRYRCMRFRGVARLGCRTKASLRVAPFGGIFDHCVRCPDRSGAAGRGFRLVEAFVVTLIGSIAACFA